MWFFNRLLRFRTAFSNFVLKYSDHVPRYSFPVLQHTEVDIKKCRASARFMSTTYLCSRMYNLASKIVILDSSFFFVFSQIQAQLEFYLQIANETKYISAFIGNYVKLFVPDVQ